MAGMNGGQKMSCIAAMASKNRGIGKDGKLPWRLRSEMKYFTRVTTNVKSEGKQNAVIMGRKTWESIPAKYVPLSGRLNVILSKTMSVAPDNVLICTDLQKALDVLSQPPYDQSIEHIFITGGYSVYKTFMHAMDTLMLCLESKKSKDYEKIVDSASTAYDFVTKQKVEAMNMPNLHRIYLTEVYMDVECDTFYPEFDKADFDIVSDPDIPTEMQEEKGIQFKYIVYEKMG